MRLRVRHTTTYAFAEPATLTVQAIRLTPQNYDGLTVLGWRVRGERTAPLPAFTDGYGNLTHLLTHRGAHTGMVISVEGEVDTHDTAGVAAGATETLPVAYYVRETPLTAPDAAIKGLAREVRGAAPDATPQALAERLVAAVADRVTYRAGVTDTGTSAAEALKAGAGVCQDHAHILCAAARLIGLPARYVSGYVWPGRNDVEEVGSHAWAELWLEGTGWVGFDTTSRQRVGQEHLRVASGLDYSEAAPVRGFRIATGGERLTVRVRVDQLAS
ncbi:transglutaminase family protein [Roseomonas sp. NAR14]|uniref:Transglutaminase family protein n=1 Tax=Roseomonas acroporae TaxID=2937791 RepID=A0A9X1Y5X6_9PROT|nr:transglutaminase family protein [Roseomonas acroporae]